MKDSGNHCTREIREVSEGCLSPARLSKSLGEFSISRDWTGKQPWKEDRWVGGLLRSLSDCISCLGSWAGWGCFVEGLANERGCQCLFACLGEIAKGLWGGVDDQNLNVQDGLKWEVTLDAGRPSELTGEKFGGCGVSRWEK